jgi:hypothetical protein
MVRRRGLLHHGRISSQVIPPKQSSGSGRGGFFLPVMVIVPRGALALFHSRMAKNESTWAVIWCKGRRVVSRKEERRKGC